MNVGIFIYDEAEVLDFSGPFEVFSTASRVEGRAVFTPFLVAQSERAVVARAGYRVLPHCYFGDCPSLDILMVVGGAHDGQMHNQTVLDWIAHTSKTVKQISSVCTGAFLLAQAGVIGAQTVTTHHADREDLQRQFPSLTVQKNKKWVEDGAVITSGGISAGIDMSLHLVGKWHSLELAQKTAGLMEYDWAC